MREEKMKKEGEKAGWAFFSPDLPRAPLGVLRGWAKACAFVSEFAVQTPQ
jgi:hypothetical protein